MIKTIKVLCLKEVPLSFIEGKEYTCRVTNEVLTSVPQLISIDESGHKKHIIAEGNFEEDEWFKEHFKLLY